LSDAITYSVIRESVIIEIKLRKLWKRLDVLGEGANHVMTSAEANSLQLTLAHAALDTVHNKFAYRRRVSTPKRAAMDDGIAPIELYCRSRVTTYAQQLSKASGTTSISFMLRLTVSRNCNGSACDFAAYSHKFSEVPR
jgi:hypothetical protein